MARLIDLGCKVADVHHRYHEIHGAMFGTASFRLILDAVLGRRKSAYKEYSQTLTGLRDELARLDPAAGAPGDLQEGLTALARLYRYEGSVHLRAAVDAIYATR